VSIPTHVIDCPFPPCVARWVVARNVWQVPYHTIRGPSVPPLFRGVFKCPGSLVGLLVGTTEPDTPSRAMMAERGRIYEERVEEWRETERERVERLRAAGGDVDETPWLAPEGRAPSDPTPGNVLYFPGRPADAPEPGPGEEPAQVVEIGTGHHLGRAAVDNAHDTTKGLVLLAIPRMEEAIYKLSGCVNALNGTTGIATMAEIEATAANALVIAAVGTGAGKPAPAEAMAEQMALGVDTIMGESADGGNIYNAVEVAKIRVTAAIQQLSSAVENARQYIALLS